MGNWPVGKGVATGKVLSPQQAGRGVIRRGPIAFENQAVEVEAKMEKEFDCPPVLLLIFRRPDLTRRVIDALSVVKPSRLYIAADGPRDRPGERQLCDETRKVATQVQWPCQLKILFRNENLGCRVGVSTAIDWFFDQEDAGIILEDDCLPSPSFFPYCAELLARFHDDERIIAISGNNFQKGRDVTPYSYYF